MYFFHNKTRTVFARCYPRIQKNKFKLHSLAIVECIRIKKLVLSVNICFTCSCHFTRIGVRPEQFADVVVQETADIKGGKIVWYG